MYLSLVTHHQAAELRKETIEANTELHIPFNPEKHALVLDGFNRFLRARDLAAEYSVPIVYELRPTFEVATYYAYKIAKQPICKELLSAGRGDAYRIDNELCVIRTDEAPKTPVFNVTATREIGETWPLSSEEITLTVTGPDKKTYKIRDAYTVAYSWLPIPMVWCGNKIKNGYEWGCYAEFAKDYEKTYEGKTTEILAKALGLSTNRIIEEK